MKTSKLMKSVAKLALILLIVSTAFISCKKSKPAQPITVTTCFDGTNNGTYTGNGTASSVPFTNTAVTFTTLSCTTAKLESTKFSTITVGSLVSSSVGSYTGTTTSGASISISFSGNNMSVGGTELSFNGIK